MNSYIPKPWHLFTLPPLFFAIGEICIYQSTRITITDKAAALETFGWIMIILGVIAAALIIWSLIWEVLIRKTDAIRYLFDSAKHLDRERTSDLLIALGLKPLPPPRSNITITNTNKTTGAYEGQKNLFDVPATIDQLRKIAVAMLEEHAPFSRRELVERRGILKDAAARELIALFEREQIISLRSPGNPNAGYMLTDYGVTFLAQYLPSPTPQEEVTINPA